MLLHLGPNVITFRTLLHLGPNVITFRTLLHLGQLLHLGLQHVSCSCYLIPPLHLTLLTMKCCSKDRLLFSRYVALHSIGSAPSLLTARKLS